MSGSEEMKRLKSYRILMDACFSDALMVKVGFMIDRTSLSEEVRQAACQSAEKAVHTYSFTRVFRSHGYLALIIQEHLKSTSLYQSRRGWSKYVVVRPDASYLPAAAPYYITSFLILEVSSSPFYLAEGLLGE